MTVASRRTGTHSRRVEQVGRTALAEIAALLGVMRSDGDGVELGPEPGLDALDPVVDDIIHAGAS